MTEQSDSIAQALIYARDLALIYKQEKVKRQELEEAYRLLAEEKKALAEEKEQLLAYAKDFRELYQQQQQTLLKIKAANLETIYCLSNAAEFRDNETGDHLQRMSHYSMLIAKTMGWPDEQAERLKHASPMHDIGKIGINDAILFKPAAYDDDEFEIMKKHTTIGYQILKDSESDLLQLGASIAWTHHEKYNGSGYPCQLKGDAIPIEGRIVALADVYDALRTARVYKPAFTRKKALAIMAEGNGSHFDPNIFDAFMASLEQIETFRETLGQESDRAGVRHQGVAVET